MLLSYYKIQPALSTKNYRMCLYMKKFALIGYPLVHSVSPFIHTELFKLNNIDGTYELLEIPAGEIGNYTETLGKLDGFNVTIPHKTDIISFTTSLSDKAELFGAVNTVKNDGALKGYNTDCIGFIRALEIAEIPLEGRVLVLGSGGVSRMFAFEAALAGADVTIASRNGETANKIRDEIKEKLGSDCGVIPLENVGGGWDLIINGTPVGMSPNADACPVSGEAVASSKAVFDAVYNPLETELIRTAKSLGKKYSNGLPMLVLQAAAAQEIWLGTSFSDSDIKDIICKTQEVLSK